MARTNAGASRATRTYTISDTNAGTHTEANTMANTSTAIHMANTGTRTCAGTRTGKDYDKQHGHKHWPAKGH